MIYRFTTLEMLAELACRHGGGAYDELLDFEYLSESARIRHRWHTTKIKPKKCSMHPAWSEPVRQPEMSEIYIRSDAKPKPDIQEPPKPYVSLASRIKAIARRRTA